MTSNDRWELDILKEKYRPSETSNNQTFGMTFFEEPPEFIKTEPTYNTDDELLSYDHDHQDGNDINATSNQSFSDTTSQYNKNEMLVTTVQQRKRPLSNAERTRRFRERNKNSASFAILNAERAKLGRRKFKTYLESLSKEQREKLIEQQRVQNRTNQRNRRNRLKQAERGEIVNTVAKKQPILEDTQKPTPSYHCEICSRQFKSKFSFIKHLETHASLKNKTIICRCSYCGNIFQSAALLQRHLLTHGKIEKVYQCDECGFTCSTSLILRRHVKLHLQPKKNINQLECHHCTLTYKTMAKLEKHLHDKHFVIQQNECLECGIFFKTKQYLQGHMLVHTSQQTFHQCQHCLVAFTENALLQKHLVVRLKEGVCNTLWPALYYGQ